MRRRRHSLLTAKRSQSGTTWTPWPCKACRCLEQSHTPHRDFHTKGVSSGSRERPSQHHMSLPGRAPLQPMPPVPRCPSHVCCTSCSATSTKQSQGTVQGGGWGLGTSTANWGHTAHGRCKNGGCPLRVCPQGLCWVILFHVPPQPCSPHSVSQVSFVELLILET